MKNFFLFFISYELNPLQLVPLHSISTAYFAITLLRHRQFFRHSVEAPFFQLCRSSAQIVFAKAAPPRSTSGFMRLPQLLAFDTSRHQFGGGRALRTTLYQIPMRPSEI